MTPRLADQVLVELSAPDRRAAVDLCVAHRESGMPLVDLVDQGLAPAMEQVGRLWQSAVWSVVDEHIATGVAETALSASALLDGRPPSREHVVVACVEGDWHSLPARMIAEVLDNEGWSVRFLGASHPTSALVDHARRHRPHAVLLGCAVPMALPALLTAVTVLHELDITVVVGGRALGRNPDRALAVGADGWAGNATDTAALLRRPTRQPRVSTASARLPDFHAVTPLLAPWSDRAMAELDLLMPAVTRYPADVRERTRADLLHLVEMANIAVLLDDRALMTEQVTWLAEVLAARGVPDRALQYGLSALLSTAPDDAAAARVADHLTASRAAASAQSLKSS